MDGAWSEDTRRPHEVSPLAATVSSPPPSLAPRESPASVRGSLALWVCAAGALLFFSSNFTPTKTSSHSAASLDALFSNADTAAFVSTLQATLLRDVLLVLSLTFSLVPAARHVFSSPLPTPPSTSTPSSSWSAKKVMMAFLVAALFVGETTCFYLILFSPLSANGAIAALLATLSHPLVTFTLSVVSGDSPPGPSGSTPFARFAAPGAGALAAVAALWYARAAHAGDHNASFHHLVGLHPSTLGFVLSLLLGSRAWILRRAHRLAVFSRAASEALTRVCVVCCAALLAVWALVALFASPSTQLLVAVPNGVQCAPSAAESSLFLAHSSSAHHQNMRSADSANALGPDAAPLLERAFTVTSIGSALLVAALLLAHLAASLRVQLSVAAPTHAHLHCMVWSASALTLQLCGALVGQTTLAIESTAAGAVFFIAFVAHLHILSQNTTSLTCGSRASLFESTDSTPSASTTTTTFTGCCGVSVSHSRARSTFQRTLSTLSSGAALFRGETLGLVLLTLALLACHQGPACPSLAPLAHTALLGHQNSLVHSKQARFLAADADLTERTAADTAPGKIRVMIKQLLEEQRRAGQQDESNLPPGTDTEADDVDLLQRIPRPDAIRTIQQEEATTIIRRASRAVVAKRTYTGLYDQSGFSTLESLVNRATVVERLAQLRAHLAEQYARFAIPGRPVALFAVPNHWNLGDSFIWLGQKAVLDSLGLPVAYTCFEVKCHRDYDTLRDRVGNGTIFIHGGGNYGDIYLFNPWLVTQLVSRFPNNRIVQLPQSVFYHNDTNAVRDLKAHFSHKDFHLMARDRPSYAYLNKILSANVSRLLPPGTPDPLKRVVMVPDSALAIGPVVPNCRPDYDVVFLSRTDTEGRHNKTGIAPLLASLNVTVYKRDWFDWQNEQPTSARALPSVSEDLPSFRFQVANNMLCRGRVVLSDRLHASILALLMGRPFVGLDNFYGKVRNVHELIFNRDDVGVIPDDVSQQYMVRSEHEAIDVILRLLGRSAPRQ